MTASDPDPSSRPPARSVRTLTRYVDALLAHNEHINLTAAASPAAAFEILVDPSLALADLWRRHPSPRLAVDIGSGNGFPGVAVAALWPDCRVVLVERRRKKARAIAACLEEAGIANAEAVGCDARELKHDHADLLGAVQLVTLRAVTSIREGNRLAAPLLAPGGRVVHWKRAGQIDREAGEGDAIARKLGLAREEDCAHGLDGLLVVYRRGVGGARR